MALLAIEDSWCLKIEIEGDEWEILLCIPSLSNPQKVLVVEFQHSLKSLIFGTSGEFLENLTKLSTYCSSIFSNENNFGAILKSDFGAFADTVEVTLVHRDSAVLTFDESATKVE